MSFHNKPNYQIPELIEALKAHRLPHDTPSQLADSFRIGWIARASHGQAPAHHARITELESQLAQRFDAADMATASAQGFRDGVASLSANAGEPRNAIDRDALIDAIAQGLHGTWHCTRVWEAWHVGTMSQDDFEPVDESETPTEIAEAVLALLAAPPAAQAEGWRPIETAPRDGAEILLYAPACVYEGAPVEARITYGKWLAPSDTPQIKYQDGFAPELEWDEFDAHWVSWDGGFTPEHPPTHWMPLPAAPGPADGESNG